MTRQEILNQIKEVMGTIPGWINTMPDTVLEQYASSFRWIRSDTALSARDKALVAFGAASAINCSY